jgi:hypothetical protein
MESMLIGWGKACYSEAGGRGENDPHRGESKRWPPLYTLGFESP